MNFILARSIRATTASFLLVNLVLATMTVTTAHAQTATGNPVQDLNNLVKGLGGFLQNIVSPKSQKLKDLVAEKKYNDAANLYANDKTYFDGQGGSIAPTLAALSTAMNSEREASLNELVRELEGLGPAASPNEAEWTSPKKFLERTDIALVEYNSYEILADKKYRSPQADKLNELSARLKTAYQANTEVAFKAFDLRREQSFVDLYPVPVSASGFSSSVMEKIDATFADSPTKDIAAFRKQYSNVFAASQLTRLNGLYVERLMAERGGGRPTFFDKLNTVRQARADGFDVGSIRDFKVIYVHVESPDGAKSPLEANSAVRVLKGEAVSTDSEANSANYLVLIQASPVDVKRKVTGKRQEGSKYQTGTRALPNPDFVAAQAKFLEAQGNYNAQRVKNATTPAYGAAAGLLNGISEAISSASVTKARQQLTSTSQTIDEPVYQSYQFDVTQLEVVRDLPFKITIIDRINRTVAQHELISRDSKSFELVYNLREQDPDVGSYRTRYADEKQLDEYEKAAGTVKFAWLGQQIVQASPSFRPLTSESMVIAETINPIRRVSLNSSELRSKQTEIGSADDVRISSVVVIRTLKGFLGTGFYITPDTVITNYHVIEGNQVVELNRNGGQKFVGRVFKTDIGLDLALIKVPELGKPVQFANSPLSSGTTVEAIGHPSGLEFTLTRGIVSAVRKMKNPLVRGSNDMLVIQTDAAISPGNSGGPLFVGNQVVGVNSQKLVRTGVEGIGFAVHYAEVQRFIQEP
ncbi:S1C family serine protease [Polaromonas sp.]|uniref:S1C family serine protease n=1 Tax=Polaromonas sp. TaxID=1869339 RepID=UPI003BAAA8B2